MDGAPLVLNSVYLVVADLPGAIAFYRRLGLDLAEEPGPHFARAVAGGGVMLEFGTAELTRGYDPNWRAPAGPGGNTLNFSLASRDGVDAMYAELVAAGYHGHLAPIDAFWGSRFAIIDDPDGNNVGLHSPRDLNRGGPPPV